MENIQKEEISRKRKAEEAIVIEEDTPEFEMEVLSGREYNKLLVAEKYTRLREIIEERTVLWKKAAKEEDKRSLYYDQIGALNDEYWTLMRTDDGEFGPRDYYEYECCECDNEEEHGCVCNWEEEYGRSDRSSDFTWTNTDDEF